VEKRLQVLLDARELAEIQRFARQQRMTTAEWVRQALRAARKAAPAADARKKLTALRAAAHHAFPVDDIDKMLREIEKGYQDPPR
jgi:methylmalonyl-CoA mutase N-terminal domain/subunit